MYPILCYQVDKNSAISGFPRIPDPLSLSPLPVKKGTPFVRGPHPIFTKIKTKSEREKKRKKEKGTEIS